MRSIRFWNVVTRGDAKQTEEAPLVGAKGRSNEITKALFRARAAGSQGIPGFRRLCPAQTVSTFLVCRKGGQGTDGLFVRCKLARGVHSTARHTDASGEGIGSMSRARSRHTRNYGKDQCEDSQSVWYRPVEMGEGAKEARRPGQPPVSPVRPALRDPVHPRLAPQSLRPRRSGMSGGSRSEVCGYSIGYRRGRGVGIPSVRIEMEQYLSRPGLLSHLGGPPERRQPGSAGAAVPAV